MGITRGEPGVWCARARAVDASDLCQGKVGCVRACPSVGVRVCVCQRVCVLGS